jgi:peroxin-6
MEPINEPFLRVNHNHTALVLGGSATSSIPYNLFASNASGFMPLQDEAVKTLASILLPALFPSDLSSKFRIAVFLYGPEGKSELCWNLQRHLICDVVLKSLNAAY